MKLKSALIPIATAMILLGAALSLVRQHGHLQFLELAAYDLLVSNLSGSPQAESDVVLILVSETDIQSLGNWPLTDRQMRDVLSRLLALDPAVLGVDIYRDLPVPPDTAALHELLAAETRVIAIEKFPSADASGIGPPPVLKDSDRVGFADLITDSGGVVRRNLLFLSNGQRTGFSFSLRLALAYLAEHDIYPAAGNPDPSHMALGEVTLIPFAGTDGGYVDADAGGYQIMLGFRDPVSSFASYSLQDLFEERIARVDVEGRIVILGVASDSVKDFFATPFSISGHAKGILPGPELHAHAAQQLVDVGLRNGQALRHWNDPVEAAWIWLWIALGFLAGWFTGSGWRFAVLLLSGAIAAVVFAGTAFIGGWWIPLVPNLLGWALAAALSSALLAAHRRRDQQLLMNLFSRHVAPQVADAIWKRREEVLDQGRVRPRTLVVTTLFTDLQGFTHMSEQMEPEPFLDWLNSYMAEMTDVIIANNGVLDDYAGDGIKANFGVPINDPERTAETAAQAVRCAMALCDALTRLNREWKSRGRECVAMRVGIHTGRVVVGTVGSPSRMKYTTVRRQVNLAARLEALKDYAAPEADDENKNCRILISADTAKLVADEFVMRDVGEYELKGISKKTRVFQVVEARVDEGG